MISFQTIPDDGTELFSQLVKISSFHKWANTSSKLVPTDMIICQEMLVEIIEKLAIDMLNDL